jgi:hypothetical protein
LPNFHLISALFLAARRTPEASFLAPALSVEHPPKARFQVNFGAKNAGFPHFRAILQRNTKKIRDCTVSGISF